MVQKMKSLVLTVTESEPEESLYPTTGTDAEKAEVRFGAKYLEDRLTHPTDGKESL